MVIVPSPLDEPLRALEAAGYARSASTHDVPGSELHLAETQYAMAHPALRRLKNALIGNANRKEDLCRSRPESVRLVVSYAFVQPAQALAAGPSELQTACEALSVLSALAIPRRICLDVLLGLSLPQLLSTTLPSLSTLLDSALSDPAYAARLAYVLHVIRTFKSLYSGLADDFDPLGSATTAYHLLVTSVRERANLGKASAVPAAGAPNRSAFGDYNAHTSKGKGPAEKAPQRSYEAVVSDLFTDKEDAQGIADLLAGLLTALQHPAPSASTAHWPVLERTTVYACELIAIAVRSSHQEFMLRTRQLPTTGAMHVGDPPTIHHMLAGSLEDRSPQLGEAIIRALTALWREAQPGTADMETRAGYTEGNAWLWTRLSDRSPSMRLATVDFHIALNKNSIFSQVTQYSKAAPLLAVLLQLLSDETHPTAIRARAGFSLALLLDGSRPLQETACNMEALLKIQRICSNLEIPLLPYETPSAAAERALLQQAALFALSSLCTEIEDIRRDVVGNAPLLRHIVGALSSPALGVRCAAAQCTRSLSRSINVLKTALLDTNAAPALAELLLAQNDGGESGQEEAELLTQIAGVAVLCNVVLQFSPLKAVLLQTEGLVERVVQMCKAPQPAGAMSVAHDEETPKARDARNLLRHHALSTVKNMTHWGSTSLKAQTVKCLGWDTIVGLLRDIAHPNLRAEMLNVIRNIACDDVANIDLCVRGIGEARLCSILEEVLRSPAQDILLHGLYIIVNIATGTEAHRSAFMNRHGLLKAILAHLNHPAPEVRVGAVWAVANLCPRPDNRPSHDNAVRLRAIGFEAKLKEMRDDPSMDVRERVRDALESCFESSHSLHDSWNSPRTLPTSSGGSFGNSASGGMLKG